ncbi:MAG: hypothetical protein KF906_08625 [Actinobacteria bacterium]|nr:hypothetical protein [Actinomycetota bacterium]
MADTTPKPLLQVALPEFSEDLAAGLIADGRPDLADQIPGLRIWSQCGCNRSDCTSFYVGPEPAGPWSEEGKHENVLPDVSHAMVVLDVVAGIIRYVEVLDYPQIRSALDAASPPPQ